MSSHILNTPLRSSADQPMPFLWRNVEGYLDLGGKGYTVKIQGNEQARQSVALLENDRKQPIWKTSLKVISYVIVVFPLLAILLRGYYRNNCDFSLEGNPSKSVGLPKNNIETSKPVQAFEKKSRAIDLENDQNVRPFRMVDGEKKIFTFDDFSKYLKKKSDIQNQIVLFKQTNNQSGNKLDEQALAQLKRLITESSQLADEINAYTLPNTDRITIQIQRIKELQTKIKSLQSETNELKKWLETSFSSKFLS